MPEFTQAEGDFVAGVLNGKPELVRKALAAGLPPNGHVFDSGTLTPLHYAADRSAKPAVVVVLIDAGADVNAWDHSANDPKTPLMHAARRGAVDVVKLLLTAGADVNAANANQSTALVSACGGGKAPAFEKVVAELLAVGAKPNPECLIWAARYGSPNMVKMLADAGADVNVAGRWGVPPLHLAAGENRPDMVVALLNLGADPHFRAPADNRNHPGQTALDVAKENKRRKVLPLLEAAAAGQKPKAAKPKPASIDDVWDRLEAALKAAAPDVRKSLKKGAAEAKLTKLEATLGVTLPADLRFTLLRHDGQKDGADGLFPEDHIEDMSGEFLLMSVAEIESEWKMWKELNDGGEFAGSTTTPDKGVRAGWWNPGWVPFATDGGGDSLCVDATPAKGGTAGQVIHMRHDSGDRPRLAKSLAELLAKLCDHYEQEGEG